MALPENICSDLIWHFDFPREPWTVQKRIELWDSFGNPTQSLLLATARLSRELGKNSLSPTLPPHPNRPMVILDTVVHSISDLKMANVWTIILNTSWN